MKPIFEQVKQTKGKVDTNKRYIRKTEVWEGDKVDSVLDLPKNSGVTYELKDYIVNGGLYFVSVFRFSEKFVNIEELSISFNRDTIPGLGSAVNESISFNSKVTSIEFAFDYLQSIDNKKKISHQDFRKAYISAFKRMELVGKGEMIGVLPKKANIKF
jgi:hypothetical protein